MAKKAYTAGQAGKTAEETVVHNDVNPVNDFDLEGQLEAKQTREQNAEYKDDSEVSEMVKIRERYSTGTDETGLAPEQKQARDGVQNDNPGSTEEEYGEKAPAEQDDDNEGQVVGAQAFQGPDDHRLMMNEAVASPTPAVENNISKAKTPYLYREG